MLEKEDGVHFRFHWRLELSDGASAHDFEHGKVVCCSYYVSEQSNKSGCSTNKGSNKQVEGRLELTCLTDG